MRISTWRNLNLKWERKQILPFLKDKSLLKHNQFVLFFFPLNRSTAELRRSSVQGRGRPSVLVVMVNVCRQIVSFLEEVRLIIIVVCCGCGLSSVKLEAMGKVKNIYGEIIKKTKQSLLLILVFRIIYHVKIKKATK